MVDNHISCLFLLINQSINKLMVSARGRYMGKQHTTNYIIGKFELVSLMLSAIQAGTTLQAANPKCTKPSISAQTHPIQPLADTHDAGISHSTM